MLTYLLNLNTLLSESIIKRDMIHINTKDEHAWLRPQTQKNHI